MVRINGRGRCTCRRRRRGCRPRRSLRGVPLRLFMMFLSPLALGRRPRPASTPLQLARERLHLLTPEVPGFAASATASGVAASRPCSAINDHAAWLSAERVASFFRCRRLIWDVTPTIIQDSFYFGNLSFLAKCSPWAHAVRTGQQASIEAVYSYSVGLCHTDEELSFAKAGRRGWRWHGGAAGSRRPGNRPRSPRAAALPGGSASTPFRARRGGRPSYGGCHGPQQRDP